MRKTLALVCVRLFHGKVEYSGGRVPNVARMPPPTTERRPVVLPFGVAETGIGTSDRINGY